MKKEASQIGKRYSSYADNYKKLFHEDHTDDCYLTILTNHLRAKSKILDIGCGTGRDIATLTQDGFEVVGIDASEKMVKIAQGLNPCSNIYQMDVTEMNFESASFDAIYSLYVLEHLKPNSFETAIHEAIRILKKGGLFLIVQHDDEAKELRPDLMTNGRKKLYRFMLPLQRLEKYLKEKSFEIIFSESRAITVNTSMESADKELAILARKK